MQWLLEARNSNFQNEQGKNQTNTNPGFEITLRMLIKAITNLTKLQHI